MGKRLSNMELLRIVSMMLVLLVHFTGAAFGLPTPAELSDNPDNSMLVKTVLESVSIIGVNCFILISGYFGIRASWKGLVNFTAWCLFASVAVLAVRLCAAAVLGRWDLLDFKVVADAFMVYSATDLWFVPAYLALYILSPVLNAGLDSLSNRKLAWFIVGLVFLNVYLGWMRGGKVNQFGYNEMQMVFMYAIGYFLHRNNDMFSRLSAGKYALCYSVFTVGIMVSAFFIDSRIAYAYNAPLVVVASISFFMIFVRIKPFHSRVINWVASSAFMVYLIHKSPFIWGGIKQQLVSMSNDHTAVVFAFASIAFFIAVFAACILLDKLRIKLFGLIPCIRGRRQ